MPADATAARLGPAKQIVAIASGRIFASEPLNAPVAGGGIIQSGRERLHEEQPLSSMGLRQNGLPLRVVDVIFVAVVLHMVGRDYV